METDNKMGQEPINKLILQMSMPPLFSMFLQYSYNLVDSMFVAKINEQALAAVSLSFPITTLMNALSIWLGVGVNVRIASYLGQKRQEKADRVATLGLIVSVILGICVNLFVLAIMKPYYRAFTNDAQIFSYGMTYMQICAFMQIPNMVHILIQKELQATGNMLAPMWFQIAGVVFNFIFDPLLIFGIGPFPKMGIAGAALATVLGYTLSMLIALVMILFTKQKVRLQFQGFRIEGKMLGDVFASGLPSFIMNALGSFMVTFVNIFLVAYSDTAVAFFGAYFKVQQLIVMTVNGLIQGCLPIMSFNYGAGKERSVTAVVSQWKKDCDMHDGSWNIVGVGFPQSDISTVFCIKSYAGVRHSGYADYGNRIYIQWDFNDGCYLCAGDEQTDTEYCDSIAAAGSSASSGYVGLQFVVPYMGNLDCVSNYRDSRYDCIHTDCKK